MDLRPSWQTTVGWASFTLLSGMAEDRLSEAGRQRLGELRRRFDMEQPPSPAAARADPLSRRSRAEAARHLSDEQWLRAMNRYDTDDRL